MIGFLIKDKLLLMLKTNLIMGWDFGVKNKKSEMDVVLHNFYTFNCEDSLELKTIL